MHWVVGESLSKRARRGGQGAGPAHDGRRRAAARRCRRVPAGGVRLATIVGRARVPRTRRVVVRARRRARVAARERRRVRRQGALAGRRPRRASSPTSFGRTGARRVLARRRRAARARSGRRSPRPRSWRDGAVEIDGIAARVGARRRVADCVRRRASTRAWHAADVAGSAGRGRSCARSGFAEQAVLVEGALDAAGVDRSTLTDDAALLDTLVVTPSGARAGARVDVRRRDRATRRCRRAPRGRRSARRDRAALVRDRRGAHGARLGAHRVDRRRPRDGRGARPHDPVVRHHPRPRHAAGRRHDRSTTPAPPRARSSDAVFAAVAAATWNALTRAEGARPDTFPARDTRASPTAPEVAMPVAPVPDPERAARRRPVLARGARRRLARARGPGRPRSRDRQAASTASRRRPARCSPTSRRCSPTAARRCTDVAKTTVFVTDLARLRAPSTRCTPKRSATTSPARSTVQVAGLPAGAARRDRSLGLHRMSNDASLSRNRYG